MLTTNCFGRFRTDQIFSNVLEHQQLEHVTRIRHGLILMLLFHFIFLTNDLRVRLWMVGRSPTTYTGITNRYKCKLNKCYATADVTVQLFVHINYFQLLNSPKKSLF